MNVLIVHSGNAIAQSSEFCGNLAVLQREEPDVITFHAGETLTLK